MRKHVAQPSIMSKLTLRRHFKDVQEKVTAPHCRINRHNRCEMLPRVSRQPSSKIIHAKIHRMKGGGNWIKKERAKQTDEEKAGERKETEQKQHLIRSVPLQCWDHKDKTGCQTAGRSDSLHLRHRGSVSGPAQTHAHSDHSDISGISSQAADCGMRSAGWNNDGGNKASQMLKNRGIINITLTTPE